MTRDNEHTQAPETIFDAFARIYKRDWNDPEAADLRDQFERGWNAGQDALLAEHDPQAWAVYLPAEDDWRLYCSQDDVGYVDDLTNNPDAEVTPLYATPVAAQAQPDHSGSVTEMVLEQPVSGADGLHRMRQAFYITEQHGNPDRAKQSWHIVFKFRDADAMHAAEAEWRAFIAASTAQPQPSGNAGEDALAAHTDLLTYVLQGDVHNRLTPRVIDIAYTAFMCAKQKNDEDGGPSDWFTDTKPTVDRAIDKLRKDLFADRAALAAQAAHSLQQNMQRDEKRGSESAQAGGQSSGNAGELPARAADQEIKSAYIRHFGSDAGWLGIEGSYFIEGHRVGLAAQASGLQQDVEALLIMLGNREYAEHWAKTDIGKRLESAMTAIHGELNVAQAGGQDALQGDAWDRIKNPLSTWGVIVRALRCVSGTTLMDMAKALDTTPAELSALEFGRAIASSQQVTQVQQFFGDRNTAVSFDLLQKAALDNRAAAKEKS